MSSLPNPAHVKAGKIAAKVLGEMKTEIKPEVKIYRLCVLAEKKILKYGGQPAFPTGVSINHVTAHYTSPAGDRSTVPDWGLVKLDVGVHIDGYIADTALTVDIDGSLEGLVAATNDALQEAIIMMNPGTSLSDVGKKIEDVIGAYGVRSIKDICGHDLKRFKLHGEKKVPNGKMRNAGLVEVGETYAIEPYASSGRSVVDSKNVYVFSNTGKDVEFEGVEEKLRIYLREKYGPFPFALRWIRAKEDLDIVQPFRELLKHKAVRGHPVIVEKSGRPVAHSEHTVFISEEGPIVLTQLD
ncbi:MAG: type II methionyl aminopeptidase [Candidatus Thorarchaeota archaeon]|nr:MAG: type II methionyl aminopeptidase [Candidatus Thorarchaeota archaeon]